MLQGFRNHFKGWVAGVIFGVIAMTFVLWGVGSYFEGHQSDKTSVASVNGVGISAQEFKQALFYYQQRVKQPLTPEVQKQLKAAVLQQLLSRLLAQQAAKKAGFVVGVGQVKAQLEQDPQLSSDGQFSEERLAMIAAREGLTVQQLYTRISQQAAQRQLPQGLQETAFVTPQQLAYYYSLDTQTRNFDTITVPFKPYLAKVTVQPQAISDFYQQHQALFVIPQQVQFAYIKLSPIALEKKVTISSQQAEQYYQQHLSNFTTPQRWYVERLLLKLPKNPSQQDIDRVQKQAAQVREQLQTQNMSALKKNHPKQWVVAEQWISAAQVSGQLLQALSNLQQGKLSAPMMTREGFNIFRLKKLQPKTTRSFAAVKDKIEALLKHQQVAKQFASMTQKLSDIAFTSPDSLQPAAKALDLTVQTSAWVSRAGAKAGLFADPKLLALAFSEDVLAQHNNSSPLTLKDSSVVVLRMKSQQPRKTKPLSAVKADITDQLKKTQAQRLAGVAVFNIVRQLRAKNSDAKQIATQGKLAYQSYTAIGRQHKQLLASILQTAFSLSLSSNPVTSMQNQAGDYVAVQLTKVNRALLASASPKKRQALRQRLQASSAQNAYQLYLLSAKASMKIQIH